MTNSDPSQSQGESYIPLSYLNAFASSVFDAYKPETLVQEDGSTTRTVRRGGYCLVETVELNGNTSYLCTSNFISINTLEETTETAKWDRDSSVLHTSHTNESQGTREIVISDPEQIQDIEVMLRRGFYPLPEEKAEDAQKSPNLLRKFLGRLSLLRHKLF